MEKMNNFKFNVRRDYCVVLENERFVVYIFDAKPRWVQVIGQATYIHLEAFYFIY